MYYGRDHDRPTINPDTIKYALILIALIYIFFLP